MRIQKVQPWRSNRYLDWVRSKPCAQCGKPDQSEAHHIIGISGGFMGGKVGDNLAVPLCHHCHMELHDAHIDLEAQVAWLVRTQAIAFHEGALGGYENGIPDALPD